MGDTGEIMDPERIDSFRELSGGSNALILELLDIYLQSAESEIKGCEQSFAGRDIETLRNHLHTLKGSTLNMGLREMYEGVEALHLDVKRGALDSFSGRIENLRSALERVRRFRESFMQEGS